MSEPTSLKAINLIKHYGKRPILLGVSLDVCQGQSVGLLGPNGAGKTTCFSIIAGLIKLDQGQVFIGDHDVSISPMYQRARLGLGYLPQEPSIFRGMTVEQNILAVLEVLDPDEERRQEKADVLMEEFMISHLRKSPAVVLSGGERRRVEIARAVAMSPKFLLLDEPLAGIDPIAMAEIKDLISHLKFKGIGILITDHNVRETLDSVDHAYIINNGQVLCHGTPDEIIRNKEVRRVYLGERFSL